MKLLHLDASILGENSASRRLSAAVVERLRRPGLDVTYRDLVAEPLPHLNALAETNPVVEEFLAADIVVIGAPMYNFTLPTQLKAWIDGIVVAGKTFRYTATGPEGLAGGKRVVIAISRGGLYGPGAPAAAMEHLESYLRQVFTVLGVTPEFIVAEGLRMGPEQAAKSIEAALQAVTELRAA